MDTSVAGVTVRVVLAERLPVAAVICVDPMVTDTPSPLEPVALLMVATRVSDEYQATVLLRFCVDLSE
jgi:hypothetical protein